MPVEAEARPNRTERVGRHVLEYEGDLLFVRWIGEHTLDEQHRIYAQIKEYLEAHGKALLLFDLRDAGQLRPEHRKASAEWWRAQPLDSIALAQYGQAPATRVLVTLITRAIGVFAGKMPQAELFATEEEARAWLAKMKPTLRPFK